MDCGQCLAFIIGVVFNMFLHNLILFVFEKTILMVMKCIRMDFVVPRQWPGLYVVLKIGNKTSMHCHSEH